VVQRPSAVRLDRRWERSPYNGVAVTLIFGKVVRFYKILKILVFLYFNAMARVLPYRAAIIVAVGSR
jgi:hypothetical protein